MDDKSARPMSGNEISARWYYSNDGVQQGPVDDGEMLAMYASAMIHPGTLVWKDGMETWQPLGQLPEWRERIAVPGDVAPYGHAGVSPTNGLAIASMTCGLISLPMMLGCWMGVVTGIPAVICGHMALSQLRRMPFQGGRGLAITGLVTGYLSIGFTLLAVLAVGIAIARDIH